MKSNSLFVVMLSLIVIAASIIAQEINVQKPDIQEEKHNAMANSKSLIGSPVYNPGGEKVGEVEDLLIDLQSGQISYAVMSFGGILGIGEDLFSLPWESVDITRDNKSFVVNVNQDASGKITRFKSSSAKDTTDDESWRDRVGKIWKSDSTTHKETPEKYKN